VFDPALDSEHVFGHNHPMARTRVRWGKVSSLVVAAGVLVALLAGRAGAGSKGDPPAVGVYVVRPGDTLWAIAEGLVGPAGDPRPVVDRLASVNRVRDGVIRPGQELRLEP
jgi:hypothetical protein